MKRDALNHPKMLDLASTLNCTRAQAIGIMTLLWDMCATFTPRGDIGKLRNGSISRSCDWHENPDEFIQALLDTGWLEAHDSHRLIVHDWPDHCEQWVKLKMQRLKIDFLDSYNRLKMPAEPSAEPSADGSASRDPNPNPNLALTKPSLANPKPTPNLDARPESHWVVRWSVGVVEKSFVDRVVEVANRFARVKHVKLDRDLVWRVSWVGVEFDVDSVNDACDRITERMVRKPLSYLNAMMRKVCEKEGVEWDSIKTLVPIAKQNTNTNAG